MLAESILNPTVFIGAFEWREPVTTLTDFLVAVVCWISVYAYYKYAERKPVQKWFFAYFLCFAVGMTSAAWLGHGLQAYVTPEYKVIGWICGATGLMFLQMGLNVFLKRSVPKWVNQTLPAIFIVQWALAVGFMVYKLPQGSVEAFKVTQVNSTIALVGVVLPMALFSYFRTKNPGMLIICGAIGFSIIPGMVYTFELSIDRWFNYHDISHVLMASFMAFMLAGTWTLNDSFDFPDT